jgi:16S rRNA (cytosine967-C5)-methyltransferase
MLEVQRLAVNVVGHVLSGRSLDTELRAIWASNNTLSAQDRSALQDITFGTLRFLGQLDGVLEALLERPLKDERIRHLLRVALFQLVHTRAAPYAIVDHAVQTASALGKAAAKGLVNAVLRNFLRRRESVLAAAASTDMGRYSHPQWWIDALREQYPEHYGQILDNANRHPPLTVRVNARRASVDAYRERLTHEGMASAALGGAAVMLDKPVPVERIPGFGEGVVSVQDAAAQYAAVLLDARAGQRVLDACAAPGGKTAHMLERADLDLTALDNDEARLARVKSNLTRLSLTAKIVCGDAARAQEWWDGTQYDAILADVPCSASGVVRRHPDVKWLRRKNDIARFAERQREILESLWRLLATDGKLLYATCSVFRQENHDQIRWFLDTHRDARHLTLPAPHTNAEQLAGQILPDERHDGFFYALLQKAGSA